MRKNTQAVANAFLAGKHLGGRSISTDGKTVYSYAMPIARRVGGVVYVIAASESPSVTTTTQINQLAQYCTDSVTVDRLPSLRDSLSDRISRGQPLTDDEQSQLVDLLGKRCSAKTKAKLAFTLRCVPDIPNWGSYQRVHLEDGTASYCAGQSYPDEIRRLRKSLITGRP